MKASQLLNQNIVANTNLTDETTRFVVVSGEDGRGMVRAPGGLLERQCIIS